MRFMVTMNDHLYTLREVITRHVRNKGDYFTVENLFGETDIINSCSNNEGKNQENGKKSRKKKPV